MTIRVLSNLEWVPENYARAGTRRSKVLTSMNARDEVIQLGRELVAQKLIEPESDSEFD